MHTPPERPQRVPFWQLVLYGASSLFRGAVHPFQRMWRSTDPLDTYALCHFTSVMGDAMLAVALADSVFFSLPVGRGEAAGRRLPRCSRCCRWRWRARCWCRCWIKAGPRRAISFGAAAGRAAVAIYAAPRFGSVLLFPLRLDPVGAVEGARDHEERPHDGLRLERGRPDAGERATGARGRDRRRGRRARSAFVFLKVWGSAGPIYLAAGVYAASALLNLRLPHPARSGPAPDSTSGARGRDPASRGCPRWAPSACAPRAGSCCSCWRSRCGTADAPAYWFAVARRRRGVVGGVRRRRRGAGGSHRPRGRRRW